MLSTDKLLNICFEMSNIVLELFLVAFRNYFGTSQIQIKQARLGCCYWDIADEGTGN